MKRKKWSLEFIEKCELISLSSVFLRWHIQITYLSLIGCFLRNNEQQNILMSSLEEISKMKRTFFLFDISSIYISFSLTHLSWSNLDFVASYSLTCHRFSPKDKRWEKKTDNWLTYKFQRNSLERTSKHSSFEICFSLKYFRWYKLLLRYLLYERIFSLMTHERLLTTLNIMNTITSLFFLLSSSFFIFFCIVE